jgi:hypothetical protein
VPYTGATANVNLGTHSLTAGVGSFASSGGGDTFTINHSSGSGIALNITKGGNGEGLYINKTSGSGNAATIIGTLNATTLVKSGGTSSQFLKADGSVDSSTYLTTSSAASTYLPLAGGTLTGPLNGTSATFTSNVTIRPASGSNAYFQVNGSALRINYLDDALTTNISAQYRAEDFVWQNNLGQQRIKLFTSGNVIIGVDNTDAGFKLDVSGTLRVTGAATFSSTVTSGSFIQTNGVGTYLRAANYIWVGGSGGDYGSVGYNQGYTATTTTYNYVFSDFASILRFDSGGFNFLTAPNGTAGNPITFTQRLRITNDGDLGIGNSGFASTKLTITGKSNTSSDFSLVCNNSSNSNLFLVRNDGAVTANGALTMNAYSFASSAIQFTRANTNTVSPGSGNGILVFAGGNAQMRIGTANDVNFDMFNGGTTHTALKIQQNGNTVLVNSPDNTLSLGLGYQGTIHGYLGGVSSRLEAFSTNGGHVYLSMGSTWIPVSDVNKKKNFETYSLGLDAVLGLKPKRYNMDFQEDGDEKQVGLIAQEVKEHIPQAFEQSEDFIGINYNVIIVTLVNAIQELKAEIDELKNR